MMIVVASLLVILIYRVQKIVLETHFVVMRIRKKKRCENAPNRVIVITLCIVSNRDMYEIAKDKWTNTYNRVFSLNMIFSTTQKVLF